MKTEAKVVTMATARQLAASGWSEPTEWVWAEVKPGRGMLVRVARLIPHERSQYPLYPAPDVSELLEALRHDLGVLELTMLSAEEVGAELYEPAKGISQCAGGDTPQQALARLWCAVAAEGKE